MFYRVSCYAESRQSGRRDGRAREFTGNPTTARLAAACQVGHAERHRLGPVRRGLPLERLQRILEALRTGRRRRMRTILAFILETGCRPGEACRLRWSDINLEGGTCVLGAHKTGHSTGRPRTIYLTPEAREILAQQRERAESEEWVFVSWLGKPYWVTALRQAFHRVGLEALGESVTDTCPTSPTPAARWSTTTS